MSVKTMSFNIEGLPPPPRHWIIIIAVFKSLYAFALLAMVLVQLCKKILLQHAMISVSKS